MKKTKKSSQVDLPGAIPEKVNIYSLSPPKHNFPGGNWGKDYLNAQGIVFCDNPLEANIFFARKFPLSLRTFLRLWWNHGLSKPLLVHTSEPRFCTLTQSGPLRLWPYPEIHVMNVYTGDAFKSNHDFFWAIQKDVPPLPPDHWQRRKNTCPIVGLATYINKRRARQKLVIDGHNIDLTLRRQELLLRGHERILLDIYGSGWPKGIVRGSSRQDGWHNEKKSILTPYLFNVALENTAWPYYCTEKIWDAIEGGCLPIYWGAGTCIYEDFPQDSFLDYSGYSGPDELLDHIEQMEEIEYRERMVRCINAHNSVFLRLNGEQDRKQKLDRLAARVRQIAQNTTVDADY